MTPAEHYAEAERLLTVSHKQVRPYLVAAAQVHATLALVAAVMTDNECATDYGDRSLITAVFG